jgi:mannose-6-phosphate isomerase-like protein (cupin superfamily)
LPELKIDSRSKVFAENSQSNFVYALRDKVVGLIGVEGLIVVDTPDALLISKKGQTEAVKALVQGVKAAGLAAAIEHNFETRPWGGFEVLNDSEQFKVKRIHVDVGAQLSYQSHQKREEHWIVIEGNAEVTLDGEKHSLGPGQAFHVPKGAKHRLSNSGTGRLVVVEVQLGSYFGEDDIVRYQDDYERE